MVTKQVLLIVLIMNSLLVHAQKLNTPDLDYLNKEIQAINVDSNYINGNWKPLLKQVKNKRVVLIGELNHGSKEIFTSRNDLIKSLHKNEGFNVILFESGIGELASINLYKNSLTSRQMTYGLIGPWWTNEFSDLMKYVKSNEMEIGGFDAQRSGSSFEKLLIPELKRLHLDSVPYLNLEQRFTIEKRKLTHRKVIYDSVQNATLNLIKDYKSKLLLFEKTDNQPSSKASLFVKITMKNRIEYLKYFLDFAKENDWNKRWKARDYIMYSNIDWLLNTIYKNQKVIIIAHNFHISKHNEKEEVMGEFLKQKYDSEMYSIGTFVGKGVYENGKKIIPPSKDNLDIKHIINPLEGRVHFLDIPQKANDKMDWLFNKIIINDTFIDLSKSNEMNLSKHFDGLIFIDKISQPEKY